MSADLKAPPPPQYHPHPHNNETKRCSFVSFGFYVPYTDNTVFKHFEHLASP